jgi:hypothetical protein
MAAADPLGRQVSRADIVRHALVQLLQSQATKRKPRRR